MNETSDFPPYVAISPVRVFVLMMLVVFSVEGAIMIALPLLPGSARSPFIEGLIDASLLTLVTAPAMWWLAVRPIKHLFEARGKLLHQLFDVQEQERARIARDLHGEIGQHLTALLVGLKTIDACADLDTAKARADQLRELAAMAHREVGRLAGGLRPGVLEELRLDAAIERLCEEFQAAHQIAVNLLFKGEIDNPLSPDAETSLYRILQEALTNAARHAKATAIAVLLQRADDRITLRVTDNGIGFESLRADSPGGNGKIGLASMHERAILLGGECRIYSEHGAGTVIQVSIPVTRSTHGKNTRSDCG